MARANKTSAWMQNAAAFAVALLFALPLLAMLTTSLRDPTKASASFSLLPDTLHWQNYAAAWRATNFPRQFINSLVMALSVTAAQIITSLMAGYAFARMEFFGKRALFLLVLATLIIPFQILVIPVFIILVKLSWINTYWALVVPSLANAFGIFLFTQFFKTIPYELEEAAYLDGASRWTILTRIITPNCQPALATVAIVSFMTSWNSFLAPLIFIDSAKLYTLPLGLWFLKGTIDDALPRDHLLSLSRAVNTLPVFRYGTNNLLQWHIPAPTSNTVEY